MRWILTFLLLSVSLHFTAHSAVFQSANSGPWANAGTWQLVSGVDADGIPDADDQVTILSPHNVSAGGSRQVHSLTLNPGSTLTWNATSYISIFGALVNNGTFGFTGSFIPYIYLEGALISGNGDFSNRFRLQTRSGTSSILNGTLLNFSFPALIVLRPGTTLRNFGYLIINNNSSILETSAANTAIFENHGIMDIDSESIMTTGFFRAHFAGSSVRVYPNISTVPRTQFGYFDLTLIPNGGPKTYSFAQNLIVVNDFNTSNNANVTVNFQNFTCSVGRDLTLHGGAAINLASLTFNGTGTQNLIGTNCNISSPAIINNGSTVVPNQSTIFSSTLTNNGTLDVSVSNQAVNFQSNLINNGTINPRTGTITFNGAAAQSISGTSTSDFYNLTLNNASGLTMNSPVLVHRSVNSSSGEYTSNGNLTLNSVAGLDAFINQSVVVNGNINVRRFLSPGPADYRDMCSPVIGAALAQWDDNLYISGPSFPDGCAFGGGCFVSAATWNATTQAYVPVTGMTQPLTNGTGFEIFIGDNLTQFFGRTVDVTGTNRNTGGLTVIARNGWNLVGNPFPSAVDFDLFARGGGIGNYFYIYDASTQGFEFYDGASGTASGSLSSQGHLASAQGFWIYNTGGLTSMTMPQTSKITTTPTFVRKPLPMLADAVQLKLSSSASEGYTVSTIDLSAFDEYAAAEDIMLFRGPQHMMRDKVAPILAVVNEEGQMVRKDLRLAADRMEVALMINTGVAATYTLSAEMIEDFSMYTCVMLFDKKTGKTTNLRNENYEFTSAGNGQDEVRFVLTLSNDNCLAKPADLISATEYVSVRNFSNTVTVMVDNHPDMKEGILTVYNSLGQVIIEPKYVAAAPATYELFLPQGEHGVYMVVVDFGSDRVVKKVVY